MNCEWMQYRFSSYLDGELSGEESQRVERHLSACQDCQTRWQELRRLDTRLQDLAVPRGLETRLMTAVQGAAGVELPRRPTSFGYRKRMVAAVIGLAAIIGWLAVGLRPDPPAADVPTPWAAVVVRSIGKVQVRAPDAEDWSDVDGASGTLIRGSRIKTPELGCAEVETAAAAQLRLDANTEMVVHGANHMQVLRGQVWCQTAAQQSLTLDTFSPTDAAEPLEMFVCPAASELQVRVDPGQAVEVGVEAPRKAWQLPLLALPGSEQDELSALVEVLLANVGQSKMQFMNADQIRALGPRGAIPLLVYVRDSHSAQQPAVRRQAMQLAAELADDSSRRLVSELAADADPLVRRLAQETLERMTPP